MNKRRSARLLAVDLGASGGKCFAGSFDNGSFSMCVVHRFAYENISFYLPDHAGRSVEHMVWDDTFIYDQILTGLRAYRCNVGKRLDAVGIDTWGADGQFITADGDMLGKVYAYRDHRLDPMITQVKARIPPGRIYAITGIHFQPFNVSNQLLWFMQHRKQLLLPGCRYVPVPSLFYYYLGGAIKVDSSWASITQLMDAKSQRWSGEILKKLGIPPAVMPEIVAPGTVIGKIQRPIAAAVGLNAASLVAVGMHDTASAFASAPVDDPRAALIISSGTWSLVGRLVPKPITTPPALQANLSNEGGIGNIRLLKNCMGGWLVHELRRVWRNADGKEMEWNQLYAQAQAAEPFSALIDPDDAGFYNPANMEKAFAAYCRKTGQRVPATRGALVRMAYESLALKYRMIDTSISAVCACKTRQVYIVGGGSQNNLLNQFTADALGLPLVAGPVEATAVGNIMVQAMGLGIIHSLSDARSIIKKSFPIRKFKPANTAVWDRAYARFCKLTP